MTMTAMMVIQELQTLADNPFTEAEVSEANQFLEAISKRHQSGNRPEIKSSSDFEEHVPYISPGVAKKLLPICELAVKSSAEVPPEQLDKLCSMFQVGLNSNAPST